MTIDENIKLINQIKEVQKVLQGLIEQTEGGPIGVYAFNASDGNVHIRYGIDHLAHAMGHGLTVDDIENCFTPYDVFFIDENGTKYRQIMTDREYQAFAKNCAVELKRRANIVPGQTVEL